MKIKTNTKDFGNKDFGTKISTVKIENIEVTLNADLMIGDYAKAYSKELVRLNPVKANELNLTPSELHYYFTSLLKFRVAQVNETLDGKEWRKLKNLAIPSWIQHTISKIGIVTDRKFGLRFMPTKVETNLSQEEYDINDISDRLLAFENDGLGLHIDAFPRDFDGDNEVMRMSILNDYVHSIKDDAHPASGYVAAFVGMKIVEEQAFSVLYRIRYDDVALIAHELIHDKDFRC